MDNAIYTDVRTHYDKLIDEGNDPVHDSEPLKNYMNKKAIKKTYALLNKNGRFVLSIDKSQDNEIVYDMRRVKTYPDNVDDIERLLNNGGFIIKKQYETEFAYIYVSEK